MKFLKAWGKGLAVVSLIAGIAFGLIGLVALSDNHVFLALTIFGAFLSLAMAVGFYGEE